MTTISIETIVLFDLVVGSLAAIGLLYMLYAASVTVHYRRFFRIIAVGLLVYAVTGPIIGQYEPALIHAIHGIATLLIAIGLVDLVWEDIVREDDVMAQLVEAPEFDLQTDEDTD